MCQSEGYKSASSRLETASTPSASISHLSQPQRITPRRKTTKVYYGDRGSWTRFLTNSFHGVLGVSSLSVTLAAWISNVYSDPSSSSSSLSLKFILLSVLTTTILSIHSSLYMLEQSPHQSTILDCKVNLWQFGRSTASMMKKNDGGSNSIHIRVVAPHRAAFHRTSIIMQYANSRILLLLHRKHWHNEGAATVSTVGGTILWGWVSLMCLRMLLGERLALPEFATRFWNNTIFTKERSTGAKTKTEPSTTTKSTLKALPPFWKNGNSYCFVLPMVASVCADFFMSVLCEYRYFKGIADDDVDDGDVSYQTIRLFDYFSDHWLSLSHLLFLQVVAHIMAFAFTLAFRIKHHGSKEKDKEATTTNNSLLVRRFYNIRTLYWLCTAGVYGLAIMGLTKAKTTFEVLKGSHEVAGSICVIWLGLVYLLF